MRLLSIVIVAGLVACSGEKLDFSLPTVESDAGLGADASATPDAFSSANCANGLSDAVSDGVSQPADLQDGHAYEDPLGEPITWSERSLPTADDAAGASATDANTPSWCGTEQSFEEVCGNDVDDDCDGSVDELVGIGESCSSVCPSAVYACDAATNSLACTTNDAACVQLGSVLCGNGTWDQGEECDPFAEGERFLVTCTGQCTVVRPFAVCVQGGLVDESRCSDEQHCNRLIGACVPFVTDEQPRCPKLRVEGGAVDEYYPMIETENRECLITCGNHACPRQLSECYMGFCAVPM